MRCQVCLVFIVLMTIPSVFTISKKLMRLQTDPLSKTRCDLMCYEARPEERSQCRSKCRAKQQKPGTCPVSDSPKWAAACIMACYTDSQCDGVQRCCHHECGAACSEPVDLLYLPGLPPVPVLEEAIEKRRSTIIKWSDGVGDAARTTPGRILYLLEEQHHLGPKYEEARLGPWNLLVRTNKTKVSLRDLLKPGRWYRFRIASVSASGTRGFSQPSAPFTPRRGPRPPPPPKKLRVRPVQSSNGNITVRLEWKEPRSDLPVMRYKVYWSRRVKGLTGELDSVLVNHQTVSKEKNHIIIRDLLPNSMYFFQVQTITQFGIGKLRSDKAAVFYNTTSTSATTSGSTTSTNATKNTGRTPSKDRDLLKVTGLKVQSYIWTNNSLYVRLIWDPVPSRNSKKHNRYFVHWRTMSCKNNSDVGFVNLAAVTQKTTFDIYEIDYECSYKVSVNKSKKAKSNDSEILINVPSCKFMEEKLLGKNQSLGCKNSGR